MKRCSKKENCINPHQIDGGWLSENQFNKVKKRGKKLRSECRYCHAFSTRQAEEKKPAVSMLKRARHRAKKFNLPINITLDDIIIPQNCPVLDIPLEITHRGPGGRGGAAFNSPSLDRLIPELGYVKGNVIVISMLANWIKNVGTADQILQVGYWLQNELAKRNQMEYN